MFDLTSKGSRSSSTTTSLLIGVNAFLLLTVAVQAAFLVKALYVSHVREERPPVKGWSRAWVVEATEDEGSGRELELFSIKD